MVDSTLKLNGQMAPLRLVIESQSLFFFHLALDAQPACLDSVSGWLNSSTCVYAGTRASVLVAQCRANSSWNLAATLPGAADKPYKATSVAHRCSSAAVVCPRQLRASTRLQAQAWPLEEVCLAEFQSTVPCSQDLKCFLCAWTTVHLGQYRSSRQDDMSLKRWGIKLLLLKFGKTSAWSRKIKTVVELFADKELQGAMLGDYVSDSTRRASSRHGAR